MSLKRARTDVTASEKLKLLEQFKKLPKMSKRKAAEALKVKRGFLRLAIQNEAKIRAEVAEQRGNNRKRHRAGKNQDVEDGLYDWYKFTKLIGVTIKGPYLRQKSEQLAQQMGYNDFSATEGWFRRWKVRYGLEWLGEVQGESKKANGNAENKNNLLKWVDIDNNVEIATEETIEKREREFVARYTEQSEIVENEVKEESEDPDPVPIPQNADMRKMLDQLRIGLEMKGFPLMEEFDTFAGKIHEFLQKDLV